jgi:tRNA G37 N-methylase Trm5
MAKTFIVAKELLNFEMHVDGVITLTPLPSEKFDEQTITLLAQTHQTFIRWYTLRNADHEDLDRVAVRYFENRRYEVTETATTRIKDHFA